MQTSSLSIRFPISVGSTTEIVVAPGKVVRVFLVDSLVPLYNVVYAGSRFMANREQVKRQIEALAAHGSEMPAPRGNGSLTQASTVPWMAMRKKAGC